MMTQAYLALTLAIVCFGSYPLVTRSAGKIGILCPWIMTATSLAVISIVAGYKAPPLSLPSTIWLRLIAAGAIMGTGFLGFTYLLAHPDIKISTVIPLLNCATLLVAVIGGAWFFSEAMTLQKMIGIFAALLAIILLRPQG